MTVEWLFLKETQCTAKRVIPLLCLPHEVWKPQNGKMRNSDANKNSLSISGFNIFITYQFTLMCLLFPLLLALSCIILHQW